MRKLEIWDQKKERQMSFFAHSPFLFPDANSKVEFEDLSMDISFDY